MMIYSLSDFSSKDSGQAIPRVVESCIRYINLYGEWYTVSSYCVTLVAVFIPSLKSSYKPTLGLSSVGESNTFTDADVRVSVYSMEICIFRPVYLFAVSSTEIPIHIVRQKPPTCMTDEFKYYLLKQIYKDSERILILSIGRCDCR